VGKASKENRQGETIAAEADANTCPPRAKPKRIRRIARPHKKPGPKPFEPTETQRAQVQCAASFGVTHLQLADFLGISKPTLEKHFATELRTAKLGTEMQVANRLLSFALGRAPDVDSKTQLSAMQFWATHVARWSPTIKQELTGKDGGPIQQDVKVDDKRTPADARALMRSFFGNVGPQEDDNAATPEAYPGGDGGTAEGAASP
jgi:hypothetical protein